MVTSHLSSGQPPSAQPGSVCVCADNDVFLAKPLGESLQLQLFGEREDLRPLVFPMRSIFAFRAYYAFSIFSHQDFFFSVRTHRKVVHGPRFSWAWSAEPTKRTGPVSQVYFPGLSHLVASRLLQVGFSSPPSEMQLPKRQGTFRMHFSVLWQALRINGRQTMGSPWQSRFLTVLRFVLIWGPAHDKQIQAGRFLIYFKYITVLKLAVCQFAQAATAKYHRLA